MKKSLCFLNRGGVVEYTIWRSSLWPWNRQVLENALSMARGPHCLLLCWKLAKVMINCVLKNAEKLAKKFLKTFFFLENAWIFLKIYEILEWRPLEITSALCPWPWLRGGWAVLGLGFFCALGLGLKPCVLDSTSVFEHITYDLCNDHNSFIPLWIKFFLIFFYHYQLLNQKTHIDRTVSYYRYPKVLVPAWSLGCHDGRSPQTGPPKLKFFYLES